MDSLWRTPTFSNFDLELFSFQEDSQPGARCVRIYTDSTLQATDWLKKDEARSLDQWTSWFQKTGFDESSPGGSMALVLCPRARVPGNVTFKKVTDHPAILGYLPFSLPSFREIIAKLRMHRALPVFLDSGVPTIARIPTSFNGRKAQVYILRVEHTMPHHTALTITHFPAAPPPSAPQTPGDPSPSPSPTPGPKTYALMLGCSPSDIVTTHTKLSSARDSITSPFTLIKIFLELEKKHRFDEVDAKITRFQDTIQNYGRLPIGAGPPGGADASGNTGANVNSQDPKNLIGLYLDVCHLKNGLAAWRAQLEELKCHVAEDFVDAGEGAEIDIDPDEYLRRLVKMYDIKVNKCDMVLQGTSLTFQMETAHLSRLDSKLARLDTEIALRDGKQMKAIAALTMVFLPATFAATLIAVPVFDWKSITSVPQWSIYLIFFVPTTAVVLLLYGAWLKWFEPTQLKLPVFKI